MAGQDIWEDVGTVVCDLDGVVFLGEVGIAGAGQALSAIAASGRQLLFVTNNSSKSATEAAAKIERTSGFPADAGSVITSAAVTAQRLAGLTATALVVGAASIEEALAAEGIATVSDWQEAGAVVVGMDRAISYERLAAATSAIRGGALFYATNTDSTYPTPEGLLPGGGAIVAAIETASEVAPVVSGKPHQAMIDHIAERATGPILVIGDRLNTDIAMARRAGWRSALVLTGVSKLADAGADDMPGLAVTSLAELAAMLD